MFRSKVAAVLSIVFLVSAGLVYWRAADLIESEARSSVERRLQVARRNLERVRQLKDYAIVARAEQIASSPRSALKSRLAKILTVPPDNYADPEGNLPEDNDYRYELHQEVNKELQAWTTTLEALAAGKTKPSSSLADQRPSKPDLFRVVDRDGIGMAGTHDPAWFGQRDDAGKWQPPNSDYAKAHAAVKTALTEGRSVKDIWMVNGAPMTVAIAPIRVGTVTQGAVVLGYQLTDAEAKRDKSLIDADVAYFVDTHLSQTSSLDTQRERAVHRLVIDRKLNQAAEGRNIVDFEYRGETYLAVVGALTGYATAPRSGFVAILNLDQAVKRAWGWSRGASQALSLYIWVVALFGLLLTLGLILGFFERFMKPFDIIDQGIMEIINGDLDYWFEIPGKQLPGTMSQNLNIMVCHLSGRPLPEDDDDVGGEHWAEDRMFVEEIDSSEFRAESVDSAAVAAGDTGGLSQAVVQLVREDEESYLRRTFREYTQGLQETGEPVQGITFEKFSSTIESNADVLQEKYGCARVRFLVEMGDGKVSLKPVPIN